MANEELAPELTRQSKPIMRMPVSSSAILSVGYRLESEELDIEFVSGGIYRYLGVPLATAIALVSAPSIGTAFSDLIRPSYDQRVVDTPIGPLVDEVAGILGRVLDVTFDAGGVRELEFALRSLRQAIELDAVAHSFGLVTTDAYRRTVNSKTREHFAFISGSGRPISENKTVWPPLADAVANDTIHWAKRRNWLWEIVRAPAASGAGRAAARGR